MRPGPIIFNDDRVFCLPHTPETDGLIGARELMLLQSPAVLVNIGRGSIVAQAALYQQSVDELMEIDRSTWKLQTLQHERLEFVVLAHLSETNNTPQKAFAEVVKALNRSKVRLSVADQYTSGPVIYLK